MSALGSQGKVLTANLLQKLIFRYGIFYITIANPDIESLKSFHKLFDKYLDHMLVTIEQNRMVRTV